MKPTVPLFSRSLFITAALITLAYGQDTDLDGIPDSTDPFPTVNAVVADPDGNNNLSTSLNTGLTGRWDCEQVTVSGSYHRIADIAGGDQPLDCRQLSMGLDSSGMISKAALFDAGNDHLAAPGTLFNNLSAFTTSMWFKTTPNYVQNKSGSIHTVFFACNGALDAYPELIVSIYKGVPGSTTQKITVSRYSGTTVQMTFYGEVPATAYVDDGRWHHLAYVKNGNNNRLFIDGVKIKESNATNGTLTATSAGYLCFGKNVPVAADQGHTFRGSMDRMRFYSRAITDAEVAELFNQDSDRDGYSDFLEKFWTGVYPMSPYLWQSPEVDTDGDGLPDYWERLYGLDPLSAIGINGGSGDLDGDGVSNVDEFQNKTKPNVIDTDGDGVSDVVEIGQASDPNNPADQGKPPIDPIETVNFATWGDFATWRMTIKGMGPRDNRELFVTAPNFNQQVNKNHKLLKNNKYKITLYFIASVPELANSWYCWEAKVDGFPSAPSFYQLGNYQVGARTTSGKSKIVKNHWLLINTDGLLTTHLHSENVNKASYLTAYLNPVGIAPDVNQSGITGAQIVSNKGDTGEKHYVSPKKTAEIPDDFVVLKATGMEPNIFTQELEWEGGEAHPTDVMKRRVKRDAAEKIVVKIKAKQGGDEASKMNVWIVWSENVAIPAVGYDFLGAGNPTDRWSYSSSPRREDFWRFRFTIQPSEIITGLDRPKLDGQNITKPPGHATLHHGLTQYPADHASLKWDTSRQLEVTVVNPNLIPKVKFPNLPEYANQPKAVDIPIAFPTDAVQGNDDPGGTGFLDEDSNPYVAYEVQTNPNLSHGIGQISCSDRPEFPFLNSTGVQGATLAHLANFKEFARLNLTSSEQNAVDGQGWFRISDYALWHCMTAATFGEHPTGSGVFRWMDAGSASATGKLSLPENP